MSAYDERRTVLLERIMLVATTAAEQSGHANYALGRIEKILENLLDETERQTKLLHDILIALKTS